jgi:mono/diheme cytochrome c family protein
MTRRPVKRLLLTLLLLLLMGAAGTALFVHSGIYNIAATRQHLAPVNWLFDHAMRRAVLFRSRGIDIPALDGEERLRNGFLLFRAQCVQCHGAPGVSPDPFSLGMTPAPANLAATGREWRANELFWVVKHGIKMTGMPAWEYRLTDREIWDVVAFMKHMPTLSPQTYAARSAELAEQKPAAPVPQAVRRGDVEAGRRAIDQYLCATCHYIPGIVGASRHVGPTLAGIGSRKYIAGILPNSEENMVRWLRATKELAPLSAMPQLGITEQDARDMAAFLATLDTL